MSASTPSSSMSEALISTSKNPMDLSSLYGDCGRMFRSSEHAQRATDLTSFKIGCETRFEHL